MSNFTPKPIYNKVIDMFIKTYQSHIETTKAEHSRLLDIKIEVDLIVESIKSTSSDIEIEPTDKYIIINEQVSKVESKMKDISILTKIKSEREIKLNKEKIILVNTLIEEHNSDKKTIDEYFTTKLNSEH